MQHLSKLVQHRTQRQKNHDRDAHHPYQCTWLQNSTSIWDGPHRWTVKHKVPAMLTERVAHSSWQFSDSGGGKRSCQWAGYKGQWGLYKSYRQMYSIAEEDCERRYKAAGLRFWTPGRFIHFTALQRQIRVLGGWWLLHTHTNSQKALWLKIGTLFFSPTGKDFKMLNYLKSQGWWIH